MSDPRTRLSGWLRGLFGGSPDGPPPWPGREDLRSGGAAVVETEVALCEVLAGAGTHGYPVDEIGTNAFGRRVVRSDATGAAGCVAAAGGLALTGVRTAGFVTAEALPVVLEPLRAHVARRTPLVLHAAAYDRGHGGFHAVAGSGALTLFARDAAHAVDLAIAARFVAERTLTPAIVAIDGPETADVRATVSLPETGLLQEFVGPPDRDIEAPTAAQRMLFGERRRTVPRWFDPDRPTALGVLPTGAEYAAAVVGRRVFFAESIVGIADESFAALGRLTGRPLPSVTTFRTGGARHVLVAQGAAVPLAEQVAADVRHRERIKVGVVGIVRNRPFPTEEVREALHDAEVVTVLERVDESETDVPPLRRDVQAALGDGGPRILSATHDGVDETAIDALFRNMGSGEGARATVRVGVAPPPTRSEFPKRQVLLQTIAREYPDLADHTLAVETGSLERPGGDTADGSIPAPSELPWVVRKFEHAESTYDSVPRFWGEFTEPRREGNEHAVPDPYLALGAVPACTATFHDRAGERDRAPRIDPRQCTACGKCWTACPDSSIAPVALTTEVLLDAAFDAVVGEAATDPAAARWKRGHRKLAARIDRAFAAGESDGWSPDLLDAEFERAIDKLGPDGAERDTVEAVTRRQRDHLVALPLSVTAPLFREPHAAEPGAGTSLLLAINPRTCQGCGVCGAVCGDGAIAIAPQDADVVDAMRSSWRAWELLPDTAGATIARAAESPSPGRMASILMSRHPLFSVTGADGAEKGSGDRLAARHVAAAVEFEMQRRVVSHARTLESLAGDLRSAVGETLARALPADDLERVEDVMRSVDTAGGRTASLSDVVSRLEGDGSAGGVDAVRVHDLARSARAVEQARWHATQGLQGVGRARYGLVVAGRIAAAWAAMFPRNPFSVPLVVDLAGEGPDLAVGVVEGTLAEIAEEARELRRARLLLESPADLPARLRALDTMTWRDLTDDERAQCPPVLVLAGRDAFDGADVAGLARLLGSRLPIKLVVLDDYDLRSPAADPAMLAMAHGNAFVLASSPASPDHLLSGVVDAIRHPGPALIHLHAPSPSRDGYATEQTVARARDAVACRVHPLMRFDPAGEGVFGLRLDLQGNPALGDTWVEGEDGRPRTPAEWLGGAERYADLDHDRIAAIATERERNWRKLQELAGVATPFTAQVRDEAERAIADAHRQELERQRAEYEARLAELRATQDIEQAARLKARLMQLAGFGKGDSSS